MKILLTGANGFLGARILARMQAQPSVTLRGMSQDDMSRYIDEVQPDAIIHTAAISDIGTCEANPEASYHANVLLPVYLAKAAPNSKLVMLSTDQVYNGNPSPGPYREGDETIPGNLYARHKLEMEQRVLDISPGAVLLRATWMYDMPLYQGDNRGNFLMNIIKSVLAGQPTAWSREQYRGLTYVREAAESMTGALQLAGGVYNFGSENSMNMYDTAQFLLSAMGAKGHLLEAGVRGNLWMDCEKARVGGVAFLNTQEGLARCLADYGMGAPGK